jgi:alpha-1,4-galacturonosyltransferase
MEQTLVKGKQIQDDCAAMVKKLRAMLLSAEEQLRVHRKQNVFLSQLTAKTLPKGLHCLPLRLTTEYYTLDSSQQHFPNQEKLEDPQLYHYALFSDNVLAAAVVVNSTVTHAKVIMFSLDMFNTSLLAKKNVKEILWLFKDNYFYILFFSFPPPPPPPQNTNTDFFSFFFFFLKNN